MMRIETAGENPNMDYDAHVRTYAGFIKLVKYGTATVVVTLIGMAVYFFML